MYLVSGNALKSSRLVRWPALVFMYSDRSGFVLQSLDLAEYNILFVLSFTTPAFDSEVAPSFGTLLATVNVALNMLAEVRRVLGKSNTQLNSSGIQ